MTEDLKGNFKTGLEKLRAAARRLRRYGIVIFLLFIALLYGFIVFRIQSLSDAQPTADAVSSQVKAARVPRVDQQVVQQLQSLQDNSVNVQTLFDQARSNPFQ